MVSQADMTLTAIWHLKWVLSCLLPDALGAGVTFSSGESSVSVSCWSNTAVLSETLLPMGQRPAPSPTSTGGITRQSFPRIVPERSNFVRGRDGVLAVYLLRETSLARQQIGLTCSLIVYKSPCTALLNYIKGLRVPAMDLDPWAGCVSAPQVL